MEIEEIKDLLENKKFNILKNELKEMNSADIPSLLEELEREQVVKLFRILSKEQAGQAFSYMEPDMKEKLIHDLTDMEDLLVKMMKEAGLDQEEE